MLPFSTADLALARRLESAEAANGFAMSAGKAEAERHCGGCALFGGVGSPMTHALGIGMEGPVDDAEFDRLEEFFRSRGSASLIDLCPLAHPTVIGQVVKRGYQVIEFNNLMLRRAAAMEEVSGTVQIRTAAPAEHGEWLRLILRGFNEGAEPTPEMVAMMEAMPRTGGELLAEVEGERCGGAVLCVQEGVALLYGDATLPAARGRGVQRALIRQRVSMAAAAGCDWVMATVLPGSGSHRNYERAGFGLAYMRVNMKREW